MEKSRLVMFLTVQSNSRLADGKGEVRDLAKQEEEESKRKKRKSCGLAPDEHPEDGDDNDDPPHVRGAEEVQVS